MNPSEMQATEIALRLKSKKETEAHPILLLGSRAGGLFRSKTFYATAKFFSLGSLPDMSRIEQFKACYTTLSDRGFSKSDIDSILLTSLKGLSFSETDIYLAELINVGIFDMVLSTNIDDMLLNAFKHVGLKEQQDFRVFIPQQNLLDELSYPHPYPFCQLCKIFGDFETGEYSLFRQDFLLETHEKLKISLPAILKNPVIVLGYDPFWDRQIDSIFPQDGGTVYFVNEENTPAAFSHILHQRKGFYIRGGEGSYEQFIQTLHWHLVEEKTFNSPLPPEMPKITTHLQLTGTIPTSVTTQQASIVKEARTRIFLCYSPQNKDYFTQLQIHLARYEREKLLDIWDNTKIQPGSQPHEEIQHTLTITKIAIVLVSAAFLASDFIAEDILPPLLQAAATEGAIILPVIVEHCVIEDTPLHQFQPFNRPDEPISTIQESERHKVWADLVRYVLTLGREKKDG